LCRQLPARDGIKITPDIAKPESVDAAARSRSAFDADEAEQFYLPQSEAAGAVDHATRPLDVPEADRCHTAAVCDLAVDQGEDAATGMRTQSAPCRDADGQQSEAISITATAMPKTLA
jgi:DNA-binding IclR family transcriptional regulator